MSVDCPLYACHFYPFLQLKQFFYSPFNETVLNDTTKQNEIMQHTDEMISTMLLKVFKMTK